MKHVGQMGNSCMAMECAECGKITPTIFNLYRTRPGCLKAICIPCSVKNHDYDFIYSRLGENTAKEEDGENECPLCGLTREHSHEI